MATAEADLHTKWYLDPSSRFSTTDMDPKFAAVPFLDWGAGSPSNTMWPVPRPTSLPSGVLSNPAIWPQQTWAKNWKGCAPFGGRGAGFPSNSVARAEAYLRAKFHLYPSKCLPTIHQRHRQDRTDTQRSDRIGRTVSQMVTQRLGSRHMILLTP